MLIPLLIHLLFCVNRELRSVRYRICSVWSDSTFHIDQLLSIDISSLPPKAVPGVLEGCCALVQQMEESRSTWFSTQLHTVCRLTDLDGLKVLLSHARPLFPHPSMAFLNELKAILDQLCFLGTAIKNECEKWILSIIDMSWTPGRSVHLSCCVFWCERTLLVFKCLPRCWLRLFDRAATLCT